MVFIVALMCLPALSGLLVVLIHLKWESEHDRYGPRWPRKRSTIGRCRAARSESMTSTFRVHPDTYSGASGQRISHAESR